MTEVKTRRPFEQRFLDGYNRSQLRQEVEKARPRWLRGVRRKYASWALGASLAFGGLGVPMAMIQNAQNEASHAAATEQAQPPETAEAIDAGIAADQQQSQSIANEVAGGVHAVAGGVTAAASGIASAAKMPLQTVAQAPQQLAAITDQIKEHFFSTQVPFGSIIYSEAKKNDLPPELVAAVVHTESKFQPMARSNKGAIGLMQLEPKTGRWMGAQNLLNPAENISAGAKYLKYLTDRFGGDQQKAVAAYNAGEGSVRRFGGVPPYRETRNYVSRVKNFQQDLGDQLQGHLEEAAATQAPAAVTQAR